jgi:ATP-dependent protease ClpP protease subunit
MSERSLDAKVVDHNGQRLAVVRLYGPMGWPNGFTSSQFIDSLHQLPTYDVLYVVFESSGGSGVDAWLIYSFLTTDHAREHRSLVLITGECSGAAILVALGFERILMRPESSLCFRPVTFIRPAATRRVSEVIARLTAKRTGSSVENVLGWMDKNRKLSAKDCLELSLCSAIV